MRVLIVDDEQPARERLSNLISALNGYQVCGQAVNGMDALEQVQQSHPDIVLMDIRMPGMDGLEAARHLAQLESPPAVIFATAYSDHALEAFDTRAVGYLLKPVRRDQLHQTLDNARRLNQAQLAELDDELQPTRTRSHICARLANRLELIAIEKIIYFQADQKYVSVRYQEGTVLIEESLKSLEQEFGQQFLRIHRNALIDKHQLSGIEKTTDGHFQVCFDVIPDRLEISRRHLPEIRRFLKLS